MLRRLLKALFAKPVGAYVCPSCDERAADREGDPCITCDMAVI